MSHGFTDRRGVFTALNDPHAGTASGQGAAAQAISNTEVIAGTYFDSGGGLHGFELSHGSQALPPPAGPHTDRLAPLLGSQP